jgi:molybdopterin-guanine dinucleotide biosynthesis protein A
MGSLPIGVVLAGGHGRRLGGAKASVELCGRPLVSYPLAALATVLEEVVVLAKDRTELPSLPASAVWIEREPRQHPLVGLIEALVLAAGRSVVVCGVDFPLLSPRLVHRLAFSGSETTSAVLACHRGAVQPLVGRYHPSALGRLRGALAADDQVSLRGVVMALGPVCVEVGDPEPLLNVNTPADLERAAAVLSRRSRTSSARAG